MASCANSGTHWQVTLMRHKTSKKVLYMEAGKEFVDLLFSFLTLPTSRVLRVTAKLGEDKRTPDTAISNVLDSVHKLQSEHLLGEKAVEQLLNQPVCADLPRDVECLLNCQRQIELTGRYEEKEFFHCGCRPLLSAYIMDSATCSSCNGQPFHRNRVMTYVRRRISANEGDGFVQGGTYMISNNLRIERASTANIMLLFAQLNVQFSDVETCQVQVAPKQVFQLLKASIWTTFDSLLNDLFPPEEHY